MYFYNTKKRYNQFSEHLKDKFGVKVYKVTLDAGFTCPNRDGSLSSEGCIFCDGSGSFAQLCSNQLSIKKQLESGIMQNREKYKAKKFMSYFQAYTNTYKDVSELKEIYDSALNEDVVGLSIGTRPDCVDDEKLDLIAEYTNDYYTWIEYGLQSVHDKSLKFINRGHDFAQFEKACINTLNRNINVCAHVVIGLPGETRNDMLKTAKTIASMGIQGVKIHLLCVLKGTKLTEMYNNNEIKIMDEDEYIETMCDFLELLPPEMTIQRLTGNGLKPILIAPGWLSKKMYLLTRIDREFERRNSYQGSKFKASLQIL